MLFLPTAVCLGGYDTPRSSIRKPFIYASLSNYEEGRNTSERGLGIFCSARDMGMMFVFARAQAEPVRVYRRTETKNNCSLRFVAGIRRE